MVDQITAFKCSLTGRVFEDPLDATACEFRTHITRFVSNMPSKSEIGAAKEIAEWLAHNLTGSIYPSAIENFLLAADYLRSHREELSQR